MDLTPENIDHYCHYIKRVLDEEQLMPLNKEAVASVIEYGVRQAGRKKKIMSKLGEISDLLREANFWAKEDQKKIVDKKSVIRAISEGEDRHRLIEEKIRELIAENIILIDTKDKRVGQANGLAVYDMGYYRFGKPSRITASVSAGKAGIINIEREAKLSGKTHDKGVMILSGYLRSQYAMEQPLNLSASLCFEQSYGGVDGDSATLIETLVLISAITDIPLRQDVAVTGSMNQKGDIQAIGGVNEKIEGFFDVCKIQGLTGNQTVIIPESNVGDLILNEEVTAAIAQNKFHVYSVSIVDDAIPIIMGTPAGARSKSGAYPKNTVNAKMMVRLKYFADLENGSKPKKKAKKKKA
jgi:ATP-dependent Lon protease